MGHGNERARQTSDSPNSFSSPLLASLTLGFVALSVYLSGIGNPPQMFYDEPSYVLAARAFLANAPNPNPEAPPLGKLLIAAGISVLGDNPIGWRVPSAVCGALALVALFVWTYLLLDDLRLALIAATLAFLNNFTFVMSRVAMMDASLVAFLMWGLAAYTAAIKLDVPPAKRRLLMCCAGLLLGLAAACKWNAVDTLLTLLLGSFALPILAKGLRLDSRSPLKLCTHSLREIGSPALAFALIVLPMFSYSLTYWPLCRSLHLPFGVHQLVEMNQYIWRFHRAVVSNRAIISPWYTWPLKASPQRALLYLLGNPVVMWGGLAALLICARRLWSAFSLPEALVVLLYGANLLQWAVTPQNGLFYYYYYPAAMILCVALAVVLRTLPASVFGVRTSFLLLSAAAAIFVWCLPKMALWGAPWDCVLGCWS